MTKKLLALYGLKWNPFAPDVPVEALHVSRRIESFCWRAEQLVGEGRVPQLPLHRRRSRSRPRRQSDHQRVSRRSGLQILDSNRPDAPGRSATLLPTDYRGIR